MSYCRLCFVVSAFEPSPGRARRISRALPRATRRPDRPFTVFTFDRIRISGGICGLPLDPAGFRCAILWRSCWNLKERLLLKKKRAEFRTQMSVMYTSNGSTIGPAFCTASQNFAVKPDQTICMQSSANRNSGQGRIGPKKKTRAACRPTRVSRTKLCEDLDAEAVAYSHKPQSARQFLTRRVGS